MTAAQTLPAAASELAAAVKEREYLRLLGLPRGRSLEGDLRARADGARQWYASHGQPFVAARRVALREVASGVIALETGEALTSTVLADRLRTHEAHALVALGASAGREVAEETKHLWATDRPDEAYFLDRFAVAVAERLVFWASATLCRASESERETLLPHLSPGCGHWDLGDQHRLMALLTGGSAPTLGPIELLSSGALHPQHSLLAALGVTRRPYTSSAEGLCRSCDLDPCAFRRAPFTNDALHAREAV